jgi:hypothetical protein
MTDAKVKIRRAYAGFKIPNETFGVKVRPSTPIVSVLRNVFGKAAYDEQGE